MEDADSLIDEIFDGEQEHDLRCIGERLRAWPPQRRLKWVKHYIDIEARTGSRRRGILEARATTEAKAGRATVTLKQRWEAAMDDKARSDRKKRRQAEFGERSLPRDAYDMMMDPSFRSRKRRA